MELYNTTKKEFVEVSITDSRYNMSCEYNIICNSCHDLVTIVIDDQEYLSGDQAKCDWWLDWCNKYDAAETDIYNLLSENKDLKGEYCNYIDGFEFNDLPSAMRNFYDENKKVLRDDD